MKIYLAGPMSGIPEFNYPLFDKVAKVLRGDGHEVVNPAELDTEEDLEGLNVVDGLGVQYLQRAEFLKRDIAELVACDAVVVLPNWQVSMGTNVEIMVAQACGIPVYPVIGVNAENPTIDTNSEPIVPNAARALTHVEQAAKARWMNPSLPWT